LLFTIITFYQFKKISKLQDFQNELKDFCRFNKIRGTIIVAEEGINGTVAGVDNSIILLISFLKKKRFTDFNPKYSFYKYMPFVRLKIKKKNEIVTFRSGIIDPENLTAKKINSLNWNNLIEQKNTILIDVRNDFEFKIGTFKNAINPNTKSFTEFKNYVDEKLTKQKNKKFAIFCTGGIRCEKASSYMIKKGFKDVNQLDGGILKYLEDTKIKESRWIGECFVFDSRVSVKNELKNGSYDLCHACRYPLSLKEKKSKKFKKGLSCPKCFGTKSSIKKKSLLERNKQIEISKKRGLYNPYLKQTPSNF